VDRTSVSAQLPKASEPLTDHWRKWPISGVKQMHAAQMTF